MWVLSFGGEEPRVGRVQAVCRHSGMSASCLDVLSPGYGHKDWGAQRLFWFVARGVKLTFHIRLKRCAGCLLLQWK